MNHPTSTIYSHTNLQTQEIFVTGTVKRTANGKTTEAPLAIDFASTPSLNTLAVTQHRFIPGSALVDTYTEALLVDAKGESAKVKSISVEPTIKDGVAKLSGPSFQWTKAQINSTSFDGAAKFETTFDFGKDAIKFKLVSSGPRAFSEEGSLDVVEKSQFFDFIRTSKAANEHAASPAEEQATQVASI